MSEVDQILGGLADNEETRERVSKWLKQVEPKQPAQPIEEVGDEAGSVSSEGYSQESPKRRTVSLFHRGAGVASPTIPPNHAPNGPTASRSGSEGHEGPPASCSGSSDRADISSAASRSSRVSSNRGKRASTGEMPGAKRRRSSSPDSAMNPGLFDQASLVRAKEGTFKPPSVMTRYLEKHLKRCLEKEEREAMYKMHPRPDAKVCTVPMPDKYITDFLGNKFPRDQDARDKKIQASVLACIRPLTSAWQSLVDAGVDRDPELRVPATEVLEMIQHTLCLIGNSSELIAQRRRATILAAIDQSWTKFSEEKFKDKEMLFGEKFQSKLTNRVEKETALAKAVSITNRHKGKESSSKKVGQSSSKFFRQSPSVKYGDGQGRRSTPYPSYPPQKQRGGYSQGRQYSRPGQKPQFHEPQFPQNQANSRPFPNRVGGANTQKRS